MMSQPTSSNLSEALINVKKLEKNFINREFTFLDRDRNKIRAKVDRHMETFLQLTRKRHETWYRHDKHFREAIRKEKDRHEKRKERSRQKLLLASNPEYIPRILTPFQAVISESFVLPPITTATEEATTTTTTTTEATITEATTTTTTTETTTALPARTPTPTPKPPSITLTVARTPTPTPKPSSIILTPRAEPMTKVDRRTHKVLRESQKLLDESAARSRYKLERNRSTSTTFFYTKPPPPPTSSSCSFNSATLIVPMTTSIDCEEYDRLINESLQRETFSEFVDHFVKFRPEFREQFGLIHEASKRQRAMEKLRSFNEKQAKTKDERYHNLISSLIDLPSEQKQKQKKMNH